VLIEENGNFLMSMMIQQPVDLRDDFWRCGPALPRRLREWQDKSPAGASTEAQVQGDLFATT